MEYKAKPTGRPSDFYVLGLVLAGGVFWSLTYFQKSLAALYQLIAFVMFAVSLYLLIRYRLTVFRLRIEGKNGAAADIHTAMAEELDFVVERVQGRKIVPLVRLSLDQLKRVDIVSLSDLKNLPGVDSLFRYEPDMSPEEGILLVFGTDGGNIAVFTDLSSEMLAFLRRIAEINRGLASE